MSTVVEKIQSRGFWRIAIRPGFYDATRVGNILDLRKIAHDTAVQLTGWDFPHVQWDKVQIGDAYVEQSTDWEHHVEYWRLQQSGQFVFFGGIWNDWLDQSHLWAKPSNWGDTGRLGVSDVAVTLVEMCEFASRLAGTVAGGDTTRVDVGLNGLKDRVLWLDAPGRVPFSQAYTTMAEKWKHGFEVNSGELVIGEWERPLKMAQDLLRRFGWDVGVDLLRGLVEGARLYQ